MKSEDPVKTEESVKAVEPAKNEKTVLVKGSASAAMAKPTPVADSEPEPTPAAMAHDKRTAIPDSGLRAGSIKPAGRARADMAKTLAAD
ncbi:hypothetical protein [Pseudoalteromonas sp.]|uniref:hypothetical protein n=1 Tax=Pseudoalteromonas sp. TaxID=53249 RepID=UPI00338FF2AD